MKSIQITSAVVAVVQGNVICPKLECNPAITAKALPAGLCFSMGTETAFDTLYARDCYDKEAQKVKESIPMFCPFNLFSK